MSTESLKGRAALVVSHCAGMIDLVALPVWVGTLIGSYGFDPQQAGGLATLFLGSAVIASLIFAPRLNRMNRRLMAGSGFALATIAFILLSLTASFPAMAVLHAVAGLAVGTALSFTHGTVGHSANPHRLFAASGLALGVIGIVILGGVPNLVAAFGGPAIFQLFAVLMAIATVVAFIAFPTTALRPDAEHGPIARGVWFGIAGIICMAFVQAMTFSFFERIGADSGYGFEAVTGVLIALGFVNLIPAPLAGFLQNRISARSVIISGPILQAVLAVTITSSTSFMPYALAGSVFVAVMIFTHTFAFGLLAQLDPSARSVAGTPAMLMLGAALGPIVGGTLIKGAGYPSLGVAAVIVALLAVVCFSQARATAPAGAAA